MKFIVLLLIYLVGIQDTFFYDKLLENFGDNYFLVINVRSDTYAGKIAVGSSDLFWYLSQTRGINEAEFKSLMKIKLMNNDTLIINSDALSRWNFNKVPHVSEIVKYKVKNKNKFITKYFYFPSLVAKEDISHAYQMAIVDKLFEWKIPTSIHDMSGSIMMPIGSKSY